ncbi:hypothetical protein [Salegentibacter sediminis]|uniref:hypothetical protein n=1 Tax=Salegentibacter sediminis TaxID=1930251 RepID=UPI0009BF70BC|nr:hypothetical protein [Salegentibacter sediminis]
MIGFGHLIKIALTLCSGERNNLIQKLKIGVYNGLNFQYKPFVASHLTQTRPYLVLFILAVILAILLLGIGAYLFGLLD